MKHLPIAGLLLLSLAACNRTPETPADASAKGATPAAATADADLATQSPADPRTDSPAQLDGFAGVKLGAGIAEVRSGFGKPLQGLGTDAAGKPLAADDGNDGCYFLRPQDAEDPRLMIEGRKLVRYDVRSAAITAPGGGKVGMTLGELQVLYPERADVGPDKYDEKAQHLRVRPAQEGGAVIDFALGADGRVGAWRVGQTPQVDYAEGCG
ncbi:hypothetical protein JY420_09855 [Stenotrophomonas maltophilia]|uniref:hypothetical protein n=1 Tax=Stenotrophomonas TaxID=40323 RepID=UPI0006BA57DA|nr:hypothetical protein [Stenotrophomonas sp. SXG-1]KPG68944.1 hypothetical protein AN993_19335 [Stenotrophomonas maltophilia]MBA0242388.1 hypothetical protein [Stenotrophomonas maltophilia]MBA0247617.1 hypothetical protein [Stenotrophomonas maltophilia]MBA0306684.1 hypothetical protein [Stenotrophomonas maltophilia]MBA0438545.1 hypothetical protein [Stenotrophomonas maltophilia]